jgi:hypothetical protein
MLAYLYSFELFWNVGNHYYRTGAIAGIAQILSQMLFISSFPTAQIAIRNLPNELIIRDVVYFPFTVALQWLLYGCLFGAWRWRRNSMERSLQIPANVAKK